MKTKSLDFGNAEETAKKTWFFNKRFLVFRLYGFTLQALALNFDSEKSVEHIKLTLFQLFDTRTEILAQASDEIISVLSWPTY